MRLSQTLLPLSYQCRCRTRIDNLSLERIYTTLNPRLIGLLLMCCHMMYCHMMPLYFTMCSSTLCSAMKLQYEQEKDLKNLLLYTFFYKQFIFDPRPENF